MLSLNFSLHFHFARGYSFYTIYGTFCARWIVSIGESGMMKGSPQVEVFCSYAREDEVWLRKLIVHLSLLEREGLLLVWHDRLLQGGMDWKQEIDDHLNRSRLILLFISPDFVASDYCYGIEMRRALELHAAKRACVIPILVRPVENWQETPFGRLQALPRDKFLVEWDKRKEDFALVQIARGIRDALINLNEMSTHAARLPRADESAIWNVPFPRKAFFTGRDKLLKRLHMQLRTVQTVISQPQAISGLGGIGKTQLAVEYAYRYGEEYRVILWVHAETTETLTTSYTEIARLLQLPQRDAQKQEIIVQGVKDWLSSQPNWLLILDNADEPDVLIQFLPPQLRGHLIVTTRAADLSNLGLGFGHALAVKPFTNKEGVPFLLRRAGLKQISFQDREYARLIVNELDGLPLALNQVGVYLKTTGSSLAAYWKMYQMQRAMLLSIQDDRAYPRSVAATLLLSFERVEQRNPVAADLLRLCAFLAPDAIPEELLSQDGGELSNELAPDAVAVFQLNLDQAFKVLNDYSLLTRDPHTRTLIVHRLVQAVLYDSMSAQTRQQWMRRAVQAVNTAFPTIEFEGWSTCERLLPHMITCADWFEQVPFATSDTATLLNKVGYYLSHRGRYKEAEPLLQRALEKSGNDPLERASILNNLAELSRLQGHFTERESYYLQALELRELHLGPNHRDVARNRNNLAILYWQQRKNELAEPLFLQALATYEQTLGPDHPDTAKSLNGLANLYQTQEKYEQAEPLYLRALHIWEQHLRPDHPYTAACMNNLAENYRQQRKYEKAEQLHLRALLIHKQQLGVEHPDTARNMNNLAQLYLQQGKYQQAEPLFLQAIASYKRFLVANHLDTAEALHGLAKLYHNQNEYIQAESFYLQALAIYEEQLGDEHSTTQSVRADYRVLTSRPPEEK
jgi:tetratricopeptide (TPR) repeat protein